MNNSYLWLIGGIFMVVVSIFLLAEFVVQFAKLIFGLILLLIGLQLIGLSRGSTKVRVR